MGKTKNVFQKRGVDYPIVDGAKTLPGKYYHSNEIYQEEMEKIFYSFWIFACRAEEIPEPGDYKLIQVGDESLIVLSPVPKSLKSLADRQQP